MFEVIRYNNSKSVRVFRQGDNDYIPIVDVATIAAPEKRYNYSNSFRKVSDKWKTSSIGTTGRKMWLVDVRGISEYIVALQGSKTKEFTKWFINSVVPKLKKTKPVDVAVAEVVAEESHKPHSQVSEFIFPVTQTPIRTIKQDGEPWFVANDVAEILGYSNPQKAVRDHCKYVKLFNKNDSFTLTTSPYGINMIPERDVYRLVMRSKLPAAEQFEEWVVGTVLPAIRKDGMYVVGEEDVLSGKKTLEEMAADCIQRLLNKNARLAQEVLALETKTIELENKADTYVDKADRLDKFVSTGGLIGITAAAKVIGVPPRKLSSFMREQDWLWKDSTTPKQWTINRGFMDTKAMFIPNGDFTKSIGFLTVMGMDKLKQLWDKKVGCSEQSATAH